MLLKALMKNIVIISIYCIYFTLTSFVWAQEKVETFSIQAKDWDSFYTLEKLKYYQNLVRISEKRQDGFENITYDVYKNMDELNKNKENILKNIHLTKIARLGNIITPTTEMYITELSKELVDVLIQNSPEDKNYLEPFSHILSNSFRTTVYITHQFSILDNLIESTFIKKAMIEMTFSPQGLKGSIIHIPLILNPQHFKIVWYYLRLEANFKMSTLKERYDSKNKTDKRTYEQVLIELNKLPHTEARLIFSSKPGTIFITNTTLYIWIKNTATNEETKIESPKQLEEYMKKENPPLSDKIKKEIENSLNNMNTSYGKIFQKFCKNYTGPITLESILNRKAFRKSWEKTFKSKINELSDFAHRRLLEDLEERGKTIEDDMEAHFSNVAEKHHDFFSTLERVDDFNSFSSLIASSYLNKNYLNSLVKTYCEYKNISLIECQKLYRQYNYSASVELHFNYESDKNGELGSYSLEIFKCEPNREVLENITPQEVQEFNKAMGAPSYYQPEHSKPDFPIEPEHEENTLDTIIIDDDQKDTPESLDEPE